MSGFTEREAMQLESLSAVDHVDRVRGRIYYSEDFKREIVRGHRAGISPTALFRSAGLGPESIGYKRIERCVARWTHSVSVADVPRKAPAKASKPVAGTRASQAPMSVLVAQTQRLNALEARIGRLERELEARP